jgi:hypothetical protein
MYTRANTVQGGYEGGTERLGELLRAEWLVIEEDSSQVIQYQT